MTAVSGWPRAIALSALLATSALLPLTACVSTPDPYSEAAVQQAVALKAESLTLLAQADGPFQSEAAASLSARVEAAESAARASGNSVAAAQWEVLTDPNGSLLGGTLARWQREGALRPVFRDEAAGLIGQGFDIIACTERAKVEPMACANPGGV